MKKASRKKNGWKITIARDEDADDDLILLMDMLEDLFLGVDLDVGIVIAEV
jgi:hypothetical protein